MGWALATGKTVAKAIFLFLQTGIEFVIEDLAGAKADVRGAVSDLVL